MPRVLAAAFLVLWATSAIAQTTTPPFVVQSDNGDNRLQLGAVVQADARFAIDDSQHNVVDTFRCGGSAHRRRAEWRATSTST